MKTYDPEKAAKVWQRVHAAAHSAKSPLPADSGIPLHRLPEMIADEWADAAVYLQMSRQFHGKDATLLRQMFEQEQSHAACLKGIYTLLTGKRTVARTQLPATGTAETLLRRCYGREMQCLALYEGLCTHPEYGPVFSRLAQQERQHCQTLLELIGKTGKG